MELFTFKVGLFVLKKFKICVQIQARDVYFLEDSDHICEFLIVQSLLSKW